MLFSIILITIVSTTILTRYYYMNMMNVSEFWRAGTIKLWFYFLATKPQKLRKSVEK